jgi:hypothetical protein
LRGDWLLHVDADERLTNELVAEINKTLAASRNENRAVTKCNRGQESSSGHRIDGYLLCKRTVFMGRWIKFGGHYPVYHLRLFRKGEGLCEHRLYDQHFVVRGAVAKLSEDYVDVLSSGIDTWIQRHTRWADLEAKQSLVDDEGIRVAPRFHGNPIERRRWCKTNVYNRLPLFVRPFFYWAYRYFFRLGFLDGKEGFVFHFLQGFGFRLLVDLKIHELRRNAIENRVQQTEVSARKAEITNGLSITGV